MRGAARLAAHLAGATGIAAALLLAPRAASAQRVQARFAEDDVERESAVLEISKWSSGGLALAAGIYAFVLQNDAEDRLEELERFCAINTAQCADVTADGAYADAELEARYQGIRRDYRDSRWLLLGAHVLGAASVVLFIVDLPRHPQPENVPYDPSRLRVGVRPDGALEASFRYPVSNILTRSP